MWLAHPGRCPGLACGRTFGAQQRRSPSSGFPPPADPAWQDHPIALAGQEAGFQVLGYTSLIISVWFFSGLLLSVLGMVGLYLGKTFEQVKNRPIYLVDIDTAAPAAA